MATEVVSREAQREFPRWPVSATKPVRVDLGPAGSGQIVDISAGGMRVKMVAPLRRDVEIPVRIEVPDQTTPVQCSGVVVWSKPNGSAGIRFTKLTDEHKSILTSWLTALEQSASESSPQRDEFARVTAQIAAMKLNNADALSLIARRVSQLANASGVVIALGKPENMICLARSGDAPELGTPIRPTPGLIGECVRGRKLVLVHDASTDPRAADLKQGSVLILPLLVNTELRGVMQVCTAHVYAFDTKTQELVQKLADAVIFVTHNVMPQRRIATVTPLPKPAPSSAPATKLPETGRFTPVSVPSVTKPSDSGRMPAFSAPPAMKPSDTGRFAAYSAPLKAATPASASVPQSPASLSMVSERSSTLDIAPLAEAVQSAPTATAVAAKLEFVRPVSIASSRQLTTAEPLPAFHPRSQSSSKLPIIVVAALVLVAAPVGFYLWHHHQQSTPVAVVTTAAAASSTANSTSAENSFTVTPAGQPLTTTSRAATPPVAAAKSAAETPHTTVEKPSAEKKPLVTKAAAPEPARMVLSSGHSVARQKVDEPETAAPSATQLGIGTSSSIPGIALPSTVSAPKLSAPVAKTWTGGTLIQRVPPVYPQAALARGLQGSVQLLIVVGPKGTVDKVRVLSGNPLLAQSAAEAVKRWRYEPFKADGEPTEREVSVTLNFNIPR
ncbi:MAG: TonB family protein [Terriglobales bacterium]